MRLVKDVVEIYRTNIFAGALVDLWFTDYEENALVINLMVTRGSGLSPVGSRASGEDSFTRLPVEALMRMFITLTTYCLRREMEET